MTDTKTPVRAPKSDLPPESLRFVGELLEEAERCCLSAFEEFLERLETESVEYGISEETLTELFLKIPSAQRETMALWFVIANLAVASVYFLGRFDKPAIRGVLAALRQSIGLKYGKRLGESAEYPLESILRILKDGPYDAYQAGVLTFLTQIGYLEHEDSTRATLDPLFLKKFRLDFAKTIPYLHAGTTGIESD